MPVKSIQEKIFANALMREGLWFVPQARCSLGGGGRSYVADFYLRTKKGRGIVVSLGSPVPSIVKANGYLVELFDLDQVQVGARALARKIKHKYNPLTAIENRKQVRARVAEIRKLLDNHHDQAEVTKMFKKRVTRS